MIIHEEYVIAPVSSSGGGLGGYYFNPNPFVEGENSFGETSATETAALALAKAFFDSNPSLEQEYNEDPMRMINIHWKDGAGVSYSSQYAKVKNGDIYDWSKLSFGGSINLANHDFIELRDGGEWITHINDNTSQIDIVQADNIAIHTKLNGLSDAIDANKADIAGNANRINVNEVAIDELKKKVNTNITNIAANASEIVKLHATDKDLQQQIDDIKAGESDFANGAKNVGPEGSVGVLREYLDSRKVVGKSIYPNPLGQLGVVEQADGGIRLSAYGQFVGVFENDSAYEQFFIRSDMPRAAVTCAILKEFLDRTVEPAVHRHNVFVQRQGENITIVPLAGELLWDDAHTRTSHNVKEIATGQGITPSWDASKSKLSIAVDPEIISSSSVPKFQHKTDDFTAVKNTGYLVSVYNATTSTSKIINVKLPANPSDGDWVVIGDYNGKVTTKDYIKIDGNGKNIHGSTTIDLNKPNAVVVLSYIDGNVNWKIVDGVGFIAGASSAFRFNPTIPAEGRNKFVGNSRELAEQARDAYFNSNDKLKPYDDDNYLLIELSISIGEGKYHAIYQNRSGNSWVDSFAGSMVLSQKGTGGTLTPLRTIRFDDTTGSYDDKNYTVSLKGIRAKILGSDFQGINDIVISNTGESKVEDGTVTIATSGGVTVDKILSLIDTTAEKSNVRIVKDDTTGKLTFNVDATAIGLTADKIVELTNVGKDIKATVESGKVSFEIDDTKLLDKLRKAETVASDSGLLRNSATVEIDRANIGGEDQIKFHAKLTAMKKDGTELKKFNRIKPGPGVVINQGNDPTAIEDIVIEMDPTFSAMEARCPSDDTPAAWKNITKIDVIGDVEMSSIDEDEGELTVNIQSNMLRALTLVNLKETRPASSNAYRLGYVENEKEMYFSDGATWEKLVNGAEHPTSFIGLYDSGAELIVAASRKGVIFVPYQTLGYVRRESLYITEKPTIFYTMWRWKLNKTNPTQEEIRNLNNWDRNDSLATAGYSTRVVGGGKGDYGSWTPEDQSSYPANTHLGQVIYYYPTDTSKHALYYSDGNTWTSLFDMPSVITPENILDLIDVNASNIDVTKVGNKLAINGYESAFIGIFDSQAEFLAYASMPHQNILFVRGKTHGYIRRASPAITGSPTVYHRMWKWNSIVTNPTIEQINDVANWNSDDSWSSHSYSIDLVGKDTDFPTWTPSSPGSYPADRYKGQIIYYNSMNSSDPAKGHYLSDGSRWTKYQSTPGIAGVEVVGKDFNKDPAEAVDEMVSKIQFGDSMNTEVVTDATGTYVRIQAKEVPFHGSVNNGQAQHITQINVDGDAAIVDKKMTIKAEKTLFVADTKDNLIKNFTPGSYKNRLGMTTGDNTIYLSTKIAYDQEEYNWSEIASKKHFADVESLTYRFPERIPKTESYVGDDYKQLREVFLTSDAVMTLEIPVVEEGFLINRYSTDGSETEYGWVQEFHGSSAGGNSWIRRRHDAGSSKSWGDWERIQTSKLEDHNHTVMICDNNEVYKQSFSDNDVMPFMVYQDPTSNIITGENSRFKFVRAGSYNVQFYTQFTWKEYPTAAQAIVEDLQHYTFEIAKVVKNNDTETFTTVKQITVEGINWDETTVPGKKLFPMVKGVVPGVVISELDIKANNVSFVFRVIIGNKTEAMMTQMSMDPYKNMIAIDPVVSRCKTGSTIVNTLYRSLGGISFQPGYEVRSQAPATVGSTPRVFGDTYSNNIIG